MSIFVYIFLCMPYGKEVNHVSIKFKSNAYVNDQLTTLLTMCVFVRHNVLRSFYMMRLNSYANLLAARWGSRTNLTLKTLSDLNISLTRLLQLI